MNYVSHGGLILGRLFRGSTSRMPNPPGYLPSLDGWRAVAIVLVLAGHTIPDAARRSWWQDLQLGGLGVQLFFGISGLLICTRLCEEQSLRGSISLAGFYVRRCFRIVPAAWVYIVFLQLVNFRWVLAVTPGETAACLFFFRNYIPGQDGVWYTGHFWSLAVEEHFYLLFPGLLVLAGARRLRWALPFFALAIAAWRTLDTRARLFDRVIPGLLVDFRTDACLDGILWGCWVALLLWHRRDLSRWLSPPVLAVLVAIVLVFHFEYRSLFWKSVLIPWMVAATVVRPDGWLSRILEWPLLRWVGRLSYSLYIWQQLFFVMDRWNRVSALSAVQRWPWSVLLLLCCAVASYYLIERPLFRLGHRLARPATPGRPETPAEQTTSLAQETLPTGFTVAATGVPSG